MKFKVTKTSKRSNTQELEEVEFEDLNAFVSFVRDAEDDVIVSVNKDDDDHEIVTLEIYDDYRE